MLQAVTITVKFYIADMPIPIDPFKRVFYADDLTEWASGVNIPDLEVTPDTHQAKTHPSKLIEESRLSLVKCLRILGGGVYLDPSL